MHKVKFPIEVNEYHSIYFGYAVWIHSVLAIRPILKAELFVTIWGQTQIIFFFHMLLYTLSFCFFSFGSGIMLELCLYLCS